MGLRPYTSYSLRCPRALAPLRRQQSSTVTSTLAATTVAPATLAPPTLATTSVATASLAAAQPTTTLASLTFTSTLAAASFTATAVATASLTASISTVAWGQGPVAASEELREATGHQINGRIWHQTRSGAWPAVSV